MCSVLELLPVGRVIVGLWVCSLSGVTFEPGQVLSGRDRRSKVRHYQQTTVVDWQEG